MFIRPWGNCYILDQVRICGEQRIKNVFPRVGLCTCCIKEKSFAMSIIFLLMPSPY